MSKVVARRRAAATVKNFRESLGDGRTGAVGLQEDWNRMVLALQESTGEDLMTWMLGDEFITTQTVVAGVNLGSQFNNPLMDMTRLRARAGQLVAHFEDFTPEPNLDSPVTQFVLNVGDGNR